MTLKTPGTRGWIFAAIAGGVVLGLPLVVHVHHQHPWDAIPGFYAWYGGLGCALIVVVSKWLGATFLQKPEDWYD